MDNRKKSMMWIYKAILFLILVISMNSQAVLAVSGSDQDKLAYDGRFKPLQYTAAGFLVLNGLIDAADKLLQESPDVKWTENVQGLQTVLSALEQSGIKVELMKLHDLTDVLKLTETNKAILLAWSNYQRAAIITTTGTDYQFDEYPVLGRRLNIVGLIEKLKPFDEGIALTVDSVKLAIRDKVGTALMSGNLQVVGGLQLPSSIHIGRIPRGAKNAYAECDLSNISSHAIQIGKIKGACSCIGKIECSSTIDAQQIGHLRVQINPSIYTGQKEFKTQIILESLENGDMIPIDISGEFDDDGYVFITPNIKDFGVLDIRSAKEKSVLVRIMEKHNNSTGMKKNTSIVSIIKSNEGIKITPEPAGDEIVGDFCEAARYRITPALPENCDRGVAQYVTFKTNDANYKELTVELRLELSGD